VKLAAVRVDGFGLLAEEEIGPFSTGLNVVIGANETGKTTLLDLVRGVLFGFPDRRRSLPQHEPLRGGRHGGALRLLDEQGGEWVVERHSERRGARVSAPGGLEADEQQLKQLLGGADDTLFRSVFAFGLGELANFETLDGDEVRELLFSAGVLGAGRSASDAARAIEQQRAALIRPRQQDVVANQLRRRLEEIDERLRIARAESAAFLERQRALEELRALTQTARERQQSLATRGDQLRRLRSAWGPYRRRAGAIEALANLGERSEALTRVLERRGEIARLEGELSGHEERRDQLAQRRTQLEGIETGLAEQLKVLGMSDLDAPLPQLAAGVEQEALSLAEAWQSGAAGLAELNSERERRSVELALAREAAARATGLTGGRSRAELTEEERGLEEIRELIADYERQEQRCDAARREQALLASGRRTGSWAGPGTVQFGVVALLAVLTALAVARSLRPVALLAAGMLLAVVVALGLFAWRRARHDDTGAAEPPEAQELARLAAKLASRAEALQLDALPARAEVDRRRAANAESRALVEAAEQQATHLEHLQGEFAALEGRIARREGELSTLLGDARAIAERLGLDPTLKPAALVAALTSLRDAHRLAEARARLMPAIDDVAGSIARFSADLTGLAAALGVEHAADATERRVLGQLRELLDGVLEQEERRRALVATSDEATEQLEEILGSGESASSALATLSSGALVEWEEELRLLAPQQAEADEDYERHLRSAFEAERALDELASSEEIADLALERESVASELDAALERWLTLGLALRLIQATLARYEAERQPVVISRAAELFSEVTAGRYVRLVAREDGDGKHHGIEAIGADGARVDAAALSRGTAEQLYLCLRLAFASNFAGRAAALPLVLDDVLVNFDPERSLAMARAIGSVAAAHQVIVLTCHPHVVQHFQAAGECRVIELARR
jgi:uncharacterized protein YhaN